jgi:PTH1 family peptidyl-tRNA hydrolase
MQPSLPKLIVGLGNPGAEYEKTRHNIGFMLIDRMIASLAAGPTEEIHRHSSQIWKYRFGGRTMWLQKPLTYMNLSGEAVAPLCRRQDIAASEVLIVYDDVDLPLGRIRIRRKGGSGGHRGMESIIGELGTSAFPRLRIGIGSARDDMIDHVLGAFSEDETTLLDDVLHTACDAVLLSVRQGTVRAMDRFNAMDLRASEADAEDVENEEHESE